MRGNSQCRTLRNASSAIPLVQVLLAQPAPHPTYALVVAATPTGTVFPIRYADFLRMKAGVYARDGVSPLGIKVPSGGIVAFVAPEGMD
jgi:hypothetical protein